MSSRALRLGEAAIIGAAMLVATAAPAQYGGHRPESRHGFTDQGYPSGYDGRGYPSAGADRDGARRQDRRARDRAARCDRGDGGTIIGAIAGGLLGNAAAGRGDRGAGTIVGAGVGALAGRALDRDC